MPLLNAVLYQKPRSLEQPDTQSPQYHSFEPARRHAGWRDPGEASWPVWLWPLGSTRVSNMSDPRKANCVRYYANLNTALVTGTKGRQENVSLNAVVQA